MSATTSELKQTLLEKRKLVREKHEEGLDGLTICGDLSQIVDDLIIELFEENKNGFKGSLVAIGGYGRGLLNPFSDVDLLFLLPASLGGAVKVPDALNVMLTKLWDIGLKVGHSTRTIADTVTMGLADLTARTAMMESRLLAGDEELFKEFLNKYSRKVAHNRPNVYILEKIDEMKRRHMAFGMVTCLTEPNLKESRGGLRDLHTAMWAIRSKTDVATVEELAGRGMMDPSDVAPVNRAHSFLMRLRNCLHWKVNKPEDNLIQSLQPDIGRSEGYVGSDNEVAAQLMYQYYEAAEIIDRFSQETTEFALNYKNRRRFWRTININIDNDGLFTDGVKLHAKSFPPHVFEEKPTLLFRIARRLSDESLKPAPNLRRGLNKLCRNAPDEWFEGKEAGRCLLAILRLKESAKALSVFHDTGILTRFIPAFADITWLSQFDMFHRYSTDEHTIHTIRKLEGIAHNAPVCLLMRDIFRTQPDLEIVKLGLLMHDLGKRAEDHHAEEDDLDRTSAILTRLGLEKLIEPIHFLVKNHLLMSVTAQRHNFTIPETLKHFCAKVGGKANLRRLYLLTYADIAGVGPKVWNDWKDKILSDLFASAEKYFIEGDALFLSEEEQLKALVKEVTRSARPVIEESVAFDFLSNAPEQYLRNSRPDTVAADIHLIKELKKERLALRYTLNPGDATGKITLAASERLGFFSIIAGALAAKNISVVEAQINTFKGRVALDKIIVEGPNLSMFSDKSTLSRFNKELGDLLDGKKNVREMVQRRLRYTQSELQSETPTQEPQAMILNHLSDEYTVVEIWAQDRVGLLYDITRTLADLKLDIKSAKISAEGRMAIDVFYVATESGGKVEDHEHEKEVVDSILVAINSPMGVD
ncbi:[Protein-PII] uridylyltransferase / [Protein-PII]-UMP uridylyl-removing enzyme [hydrothermal vent metagenome]|uniref:[Protein-PII] uridylyltransferase / [Protein-PII]-UMP uridylyl-removing enzyme n=1 Tax=hydrothermal vent metagenome TaxID=652676 RepID=A0A3B1BL30_9ZZZZ